MAHKTKRSGRKQRQDFFRLIKLLAAVLNWIISFALMLLALWDRLMNQ